MPKHLTDPDLHPSWLHRDTYVKCDDGNLTVRAGFEFPARPGVSSLISIGGRDEVGACGESSTGTGTGPHSLALTAPHGEPVPVGHLTLIERIKEAARV